MTGFIAALTEAWTELRIHRARVLLSLFGVAVAVAALTASVALGDIVRQLSTEQAIRSSGPPATISFQVSGSGQQQLSAAEVQETWDAAVERYDIRYATAAIYGQQVPIRALGSTTMGQAMGVGVDYAAIHRVDIVEGRWFVDADADRLAPVAVVNRALLDAVGIRDLSGHPQVSFGNGVTATIIGVAQGGNFQWSPTAALLGDDAMRVLPAEQAQYAIPQFETWVPPESAELVKSMITRDLQRAFPDATVDANRTDYLYIQEQSGVDATEIMRLILVGVSSVILLLGALSLVNIAVVTVRHRVREVGIRRAFGASRGRIFFAVMLESVVATVLAGVVGIVVIIFLYRLPFLPALVGLGQTGSAFPPFPMGAAIVGVVVATLVGAIAGAIPALIAVRSKVIDAIRF